MLNNGFDVNILVNGNRCKTYFHNGKTYIESKHDTEYELEIKNNTWNRCLILATVDGLNVLNGSTASEHNPGYVISPYSPLRIKGFRYSNNEVAAFKFTNKDNSYAQSIGGNTSAQNCGVIGFNIYSELIKPTPKPYIVWDQTQTCFDTLNEVYYNSDNTSNNMLCDTKFNGNVQNCFFNQSLSAQPIRGRGISATLNLNTNQLNNFDMGSTWGQKVVSKVLETEFEKGFLSLSLDIFYASKNSLINMGVPINTENHVFFPQSFPNKYASPPNNWRG